MHEPLETKLARFSLSRKFIADEVNHWMYGPFRVLCSVLQIRVIKISVIKIAISLAIHTLNPMGQWFDLHIFLPYKLLRSTLSSSYECHVTNHLTTQRSFHDTFPLERDRPHFQ